MINFSEIKIGDIVMTDYEGVRAEGEVTELNHEDKEVCVETDVQEFWFTPDQLFPIPLDDDQLKKFHFEKKENGDGTVKYMRGPFRIQLPQKGSFSNFEMWYREDRRHMSHPVTVHELQNHYHQMTKVELTR
ncbi:MAG TPA: hypothetical protein VMI12_12750 [Puia sp.]|nr:hypothetical protein [Puia sp.]